MSKTWIIAVLAVSSVGVAQSKTVKECREQGMVPRYNEQGTLVGCMNPQLAEVPKNCHFVDDPCGEKGQKVEVCACKECGDAKPPTCGVDEPEPDVPLNHSDSNGRISN